MKQDVLVKRLRDRLVWATLGVKALLGDGICGTGVTGQVISSEFGAGKGAAALIIRDIGRLSARCDGPSRGGQTTPRFSGDRP